MMETRCTASERDQRVSRLMPRDPLLLLRAHDTGAFLKSQQDAIDGFLEIPHFDLGCGARSGAKGRLVHHVRQVRP